MAAIIKLRRGTIANKSNITLQQSELFYNTSLHTIQVGTTGSNISDYVTLVKLDSLNSGSLNVNGSITASNITVHNDITIGGNIFLGDSVADNITIAGEFSSSLIPNDHNEYDLGSLSKSWRHVHTQNATIHNINLPGSDIVSSSQQISDYNVFLEINGDSVFSQSVQIDHDSTTNFVANEHINHTSVNIQPGLGISGGGDISTSRTITLDTGSEHFGSGVINALTGSDIVSSSQQIADYNRFLEFDGDNVVSSSQQIADYNRFLEFDGDDVVSSSQQIANYNRFLEFNGDDVVSSSQQVIDHLHGSDIVSSSQQIQNYNTFLEFNGDDVVSSSQQISDYNRFLEFNGDNVLSSSDENFSDFSESVDLRLVNTETTASDHETRIDTLEISFSSSVDTRLDDLESTGSDHETRIDTIETTFSSSVDTRLDDLESTGSDHETRIDDLEGSFSSSVDSRLDSLQTYTSSLKDSIDVNGANLTVLGNLTVQGTQTSLNTNELIVEDKLIALASGSTTSAEADGAGIFISGANASILWNHGDSLLEVNNKFSSSVGFKGDGSELTGLGYANVVFDGSGIVSRSAQIVLDDADKTGFTTQDVQEHSTNLYYTDERVESVLHTQQVISESAQVNANSITNFDSNVLDKINAEGVFSSSIQVNANTITNFDSNVLSYINGLNVHSSSFLGTATTSNLTEGTNLYYTDTRVKNKLNDDGVISSSLQLQDNYDLRYLEINGDSVISQSAQVDINSTSGNLTSLGTVTTGNIVQILPTGTLSGSDQVNADTITNFDSNVDARLDSKDVISGSDQVNADSVLNFDSNVDDRLNSKEVLSGSVTSPSQGTVRINNSNVDLGLDTSDSPSFEGLTLTNLSSLGAGNVNALISGSAGTVGFRSLGTAGFLNVSASVGDDPNSIPTNRAVNNALIAAGAGDLTEFNPSNTFDSNNTGLVHLSTGTLIGGVRGVQGNIHVAIDTGSTHFIDGVTDSLPNGLLSSSEQVTDSSGIVSSSQQVVDFLPSGTVSQSAQITITESQISDLSHYGDSDVKTKLNTEDVVSGSASDVRTFLNVADGATNYGDTNVKTKLNTEGVISSSLQILDGSNVLSSSDENFSDFSESVDTRLDTLEEESHENPLTFNDTTTIKLTRVTNTITADAIGGIVSGSVLRPDGDDVVSGSVLRPDGDGIVSQSLLNDLTNGEVNQLKNINSSTISSAQWGYVGNMNQNVRTSDSVTFSDLVVSNNLTVQGTETTLNTANLLIEDKLISVASGSTTSAEADGAGLHISGANEKITWDHGNSRFNVSDDLFVDGTLKASDDIVAYASSDERLKNNIQQISNPLEKITNIGGYTFDWDEEKQNTYKGRDYGVIAQEIENVAPELVDTRGNGYKAVKYEKIVPILIESIKELKREIEELKKSK